MMTIVLKLPPFSFTWHLWCFLFVIVSLYSVNSIVFTWDSFVNMNKKCKILVEEPNNPGEMFTYWDQVILIMLLT